MEYCKIKFRFLLVLAFFGLCLTIPAPNPVVNRRYGARPNFEPETKAYMAAVAVPYNGSVFYGGTAYEITGRSLWTAVNNYVLGLKEIGWSKFVAVYPYIGGTSISDSKNLIDPTKFPITFFGGVSHTGAGASFGVAAYGYSGLVPSVNLSLNKTFFCASLSGTTASNPIAIGVQCGVTYAFLRVPIFSTVSIGQSVNDLATAGTNPVTSSNVAILRQSSAGYTVVLDQSNTVVKSIPSVSLCTIPLQINGYNNGGVPTGADAFTHKILIAGTELSVIEAKRLLILNSTLNTTLNR